MKMNVFVFSQSQSVVTLFSAVVVHDTSVIIYEGHIFTFKMKKVRCGPRIWIVHQLIWESKVLLVKR